MNYDWDEFSHQKRSMSNRKGRAILVYDAITLSYIDDYPTMALAEEDLGLSTCVINKCMKNKYCPGFYSKKWSKEDNYIFTFRPLETRDGFIIFRLTNHIEEIRKAKRYGFDVRYVKEQIWIGKWI